MYFLGALVRKETVSQINPYVQQANNAISDTMKFLSTYQANPAATGTSTDPTVDPTTGLPTTTTGDPSQLSSMLQLMMMMIMMEFMGGAGASQGALGTTGTMDPFAGFPNNQDLINNQQTCTDGNGTGSSNSSSGNPAFDFLNQQDPTTLSDPNAFSDTLEQQMTSGNFTEGQLGQAMMAGIDQAPDDTTSGALSNVLGQLVQRGDLNAVPFMSDNYLNMLPVSRQNQVFDAVLNAGVSYSDGSPNRSLMSYLLSAEDDNTSPMAQNFAQQLIADYNTQPSNQSDPNMQAFLTLAQPQPTTTV